MSLLWAGLLTMAGIGIVALIVAVCAMPADPAGGDQ